MTECVFYCYVRYIDGKKIPSGIKSCVLEYGRKCPCKDYRKPVYSKLKK